MTGDRDREGRLGNRRSPQGDYFRCGRKETVERRINSLKEEDNSLVMADKRISGNNFGKISFTGDA